MKKSLFLIPLLGLMAAGCSNDIPNDPSGGQGNYTDDIKGYLSVGLVAPSGNFTRALDGYLDGTSSENYVSNVRFYFFNEDGSPVMIRKNPDQELEDDANKYFSFCDWTPTTDENENFDKDDEETVEKILSTTITLNGPEGVALPDNMELIAVVNPTQNIKALNNLTKSQLLSEIANFKTNLTDNNFVMSNSVYVGEDADKQAMLINSQTVETKKNVASTIKDAQANPVIVYVERVVARLDFSLELEKSENGMYKVNDALDFLIPDGVDRDTTINKYKQDIYFDMTGWTITCAPNQSYLIKSINQNWPENMFGNTEPWNSDDFHRSFWAINPEKLDQDPYEYYDFYSFNDINNSGLALPTKENPKVTAYTQENANPYETAESPSTGSNPTYPTKVILTGQLKNSKGEILTIAEYNQQHYTVQGLKLVIANMLDMYKKKADGNGYEKILPEDITFITKKNWIIPEEFDPLNPEQGGYYHVYFTLTPEALKNKWYHKVAATSDDDSQGNYTTISNVNQYLYDRAGYAMIWNGGKTYYYFEVKHLGTKGNTGYYGIVRNHIYDTKVNGISGLGTPVYDPDEVIYPERPDRSGNLITAQIRILQWRIVTQSYNLAW